MKVNLPEPTSYVVLRFDDQATSYVQLMKDKLTKFYELKPIKSKPHFTFTDWTGDRQELLKRLSFFCEGHTKFDFTLWGVGSFVSRGAVFLEPKDKDAFRALQYHLVAVLGKPKSEYLEPGLWNPHCTVIKGLKKGLLKHAELQLFADFCVSDAKALGFEIITKGHDPLFVELS